MFEYNRFKQRLTLNQLTIYTLKVINALNLLHDPFLHGQNAEWH